MSNRPLLDYSRADYAAMRQELSAVDWLQTLQGDANEQWNTFISIMRKLESQYIPLKKPSIQTKKAPWMSFKAAKLVNKSINCTRNINVKVIQRT